MNSPQAPDPYVTSAMQSGLNQQAAQQSQKDNMVSQTNPYGSLNYASDPNSPSGYRATTTLSAPEQAIFDQQTANQGQTGKDAAAMLNSGAGVFSGQPLDLGWSATESNLDALNRQRLDPQWQQASEQEAQSLANQGLQPGSAGYDNQMRTFNQGKNDAYNSSYAANHAQAVSDLTNEYNAPLNAYSALQSGSQVQTPNSSFVSTPQTSVQPVNLQGALNQNYQNQLQQNNATMGGMFGLGGNLITGAASLFSPKPTVNFGIGGTQQ